MDRIAMLLIGLIFGAGLGFVVAAGAGVTLAGHDHEAHGVGEIDHAAHGGGDHEAMHGTPVPLPLGTNAPSLAVQLTPDPVSGWNLHVETQNFAFAPEKAGAPHVPGEGHAHVYVDGEKIARLYGPWLHIAALPPGSTVEVTLNANDHRPLSVHGHTLAAKATVPAE